ncbi:hypothetical protein BD626DRAFT_513237 [Schizophyllum amplum]|uniref:RING-type domain-containing protein n=1 Tax=Schizophyllum amplum TaxID=97359 RepID=A0A550BZI4_9AGAR|nr:hypothetical protein BD626DRAFT_513237 [Auriculariopsis ampla]
MDCGICTDGLREPVSTKCGHVFCDACINEVIKRAGRGKSANCPTCQKELKGPSRPLLKLALDTSRHDELRHTNVSLRNELKESLLECERTKNYISHLERELRGIKRQHADADADTQRYKRRCYRAEDDAARFRNALLVKVGALVTIAGGLAVQGMMEDGMVDEDDYLVDEEEEGDDEDCDPARVAAPTSDTAVDDENPFVERSDDGLFSSKVRADPSAMSAAAEAMIQQARRYALEDEESSVDH